MSESKHTSDQLIGCGDHSCLFARPKGPGTNGGCRCAREPGRLAHNVRVLRRQRDELLEALELLVALPVRCRANRIEIDTGSYGEAMEIVRKSRAAIAKATGEAK